MTPLLALALAPLSGALAFQADAALRVLEQGAFEEAHGLLAAETDPLERARGEAELFHRARDPLRALEAAEAGLAAYPGDLRLLFRASAACLWLGLAEPAVEYAARLEQALPGAELSADERAAWRRAGEEFAAAAEDLALAAEVRVAAVRRARVVSGAVMGGALLALGSLFVRSVRASRGGTPRVPGPASR